VLNRIFPGRLDNAYRGHWLAVWLLALVSLAKAAQGAESIFNTYAVATGADGVPLGQFNAAAAQEVMSLFQLLGMYLCVVPLVSLVAVIRYRTMTPLLFVMYLLLYAGTRTFSMLHPAARSEGHPVGFYVNLGILAVTLLGLVLSLQRKATASDTPGGVPNRLDS